MIIDHFENITFEVYYSPYSYLIGIIIIKMARRYLAAGTEEWQYVHEEHSIEVERMAGHKDSIEVDKIGGRKNSLEWVRVGGHKGSMAVDEEADHAVNEGVDRLAGHNGIEMDRAAGHKTSLEGGEVVDRMVMVQGQYDHFRPDMVTGLQKIGEVL